MKRFAQLLLGCLLPGCAADAVVPAADLALTHATVISVTDGERLADRTILVEHGRIVAVEPAARVRIPAGARVVDATGRYVIPGLWDAHVHSAYNTAWHFPLLLAHGVTAVRNMHTSVDTALELTAAIKRRLASGELLGPRFLANGPIVDGERTVQPGSVPARTPGEGRAVVDSLAAGGADFIKVYSNLSRDAYLAIADQARRRGLPLDGHVPFQVTPVEAAAAGQRTAEHLFGISLGCSSVADSLRAEHASLLAGDPPPAEALGDAFFALTRAAVESRDAARCADAIRAYRRAGVAVVPTLAIVAAFANPAAAVGDTARMRLVPERLRRQWNDMAAGGWFEGAVGPRTLAQALDNLRLLRSAGVTLLAGTDLGNPFLVPGVSLHDELALLAEAGLSPLEVLQAATLHPASVFGLADSLGTVAPGKAADLVLLSADPLKDVRHTRLVTGVVVGGRYLDAGALEPNDSSRRRPRAADRPIAADRRPGVPLSVIVAPPRRPHLPSSTANPVPIVARRTGGGVMIAERATVLIVDDEESLRRLVSRILVGVGLRVLEAEHGQAALHLIRGQAPRVHLVVSDIHMPVMDGVEFAREFRLLQPLVPILFITGREFPTLEGEVLRKPFGPDALLREVFRLIGRSGGVGQERQ